MPPKAPVSPRIEALESELELTRLRLGGDLSALRGKVSPAGLAQEASGLLRRARASGTPEGAALGAAGPNQPAFPRSSPVLTLLGAGLAWLLLRSSRQEREV